MKKGDYYTPSQMMIWIARLICTIGAILIILALINYASVKEVNVRNLQMALEMKKIYYSEKCLALKDARVRPGVIDLEKFNKERLMECLEGFSFRVELVKEQIVIFSDDFEKEKGYCREEEKKCIGEIFNINEMSDKIEECKDDFKRCLYSTQQYVLVNDEGDLLKIELIKYDA